MTYDTRYGEVSDSTQVVLGDLGTSGSAMLAYLGMNSLWYAEWDAKTSVDAAEARGAPPQIVATWRQLIPVYVANKDFDSLLALQLEADGWTAAGNQGPVTQQVVDTVAAIQKRAEDALNKAKEGAESTVNKVVLFGAGLAVLYVVLKARK